MDNFYYFYKVRYYNDAIPQSATGIVYGKTWTDVMAHLVEYYGELEMFAIDQLITLNDGYSCVEFDEMNLNLKGEGFQIIPIKETEYKNHNITTFEEEV